MVTRTRAARPGARAAAVAFAVAALAVTGCGPSGTAPPDDGAAVAAGGAGGAEPAAGAPDLGRGELLALACRACHTFEPGAGHAIGPSLHGVFGRRAAALDDFEYSAALTEAGFVWTPERLEAWLAEPDDYVPGTTMTFTGYRSAADRRALIAYLERVTARPGPAPGP